MSRITELGKELADLKAKKTSLEDQLKSVNKQIGALQMGVLPEAMDEADIPKFTIEDVGTIFLQDKINVSILAGDREKVYEWCKANGHEALVVDYIHPSTLNAWAKEQLTNGGELPEQMKATFLPTAVLRRKS